MWKELLPVVALIAILLPLSDGIKWGNQQSRVCFLKPDCGPCKARIVRYYYDSKRKQCRTFFYGGCGGNGNNFKTLSQCLRKCSKSKSKPGYCPPKRRWVEMQLRKIVSRRYVYRFRCTNDYQCSGRKKCCRTRWRSRSKHCVTPRYRRVIRRG